MVKNFSPAALQIHCISSSFLAPQTIIFINKNLQFIGFATNKNSIRMWNFLYFLIFCCLRIFSYFFLLETSWNFNVLIFCFKSPEFCSFLLLAEFYLLSSYFLFQILWILFVLITWKQIILRILLNFLVLIFFETLLFFVIIIF